MPKRGVIVLLTIGLFAVGFWWLEARPILKKNPSQLRLANHKCAPVPLMFQGKCSGKPLSCKTEKKERIKTLSCPEGCILNGQPHFWVSKTDKAFDSKVYRKINSRNLDEVLRSACSGMKAGGSCAIRAVQLCGASH